MTTNWYVDRGATGTGSGDTPANASTNLTSLSNASSVQFGDRIWVRRTFTSQQTGETWGRTGFALATNRLLSIIGWPNSDDPYFADRPTAGTSAGWDSDTATPFAGINYPTVVLSRSATPASGLTRNGTFITNFCLASSIAFSRLDPDGLVTNTQQSRAGKLVFFNGDPRFITQTDEVILVSSIGNSTAPGIDGDVCVRRFVITGSCSSNGAMFGGSRLVDISELVNASNSINSLLSFGTGVFNHRFGVVRGNSFVRSGGMFGNNFSDTNYGDIIVDDWFGQGPARVSGTGFQVRAVTSATANFSGQPATALSVSSSSFGNLDAWNFRNNRFGQVAQYQAVNSGVGYRLNWHFHTTLCGCLDFHRTGYLMMTGSGGRLNYLSVLNSGILPGSAGFWSGQSTTAGSAWIMTTVFTPTYTGTAHIFGRVPGYTSVTTGFVFVSPFIEVTS